VTVRLTSEQIIQQELAQRVADLSARVCELSRRVESIDSGSDVVAPDPKTKTSVYESDEWSNPIEFMTESGFVIVRPWETDGSPPPTDGRCRFEVIDPKGNEQIVGVNISNRLIAETVAKTNDRIGPLDSFWICCAERRLASYVEEHNSFPAANEITVDEFDREDILLAIRWGKSDCPQ